ncbi:MAG: YhjD/YihY/BrkB family envelope integrity protein [Frankiaceae bacterium]
MQELVQRLAGLHFATTITMFGAAFLLSTLPLIILLSSFASRRIEDDLARHLGLNARATQIVEQLFHSSSKHSTSALVLALVLGLAGTIGVAGSMQSAYEQIFGQLHHGDARNILRLLLWIVGAAGWLILDGIINDAVRGMPGSAVLRGLAIPIVSGAFFWWSMHLLLAGKLTWHALLRPAVATGLFWMGLEAFAALYFSPTITSDSRLYGTIGVVFSLLTWFIAIAAVVVLGALTGHVWQSRRTPRSTPVRRAPAISDRS